MLYLYRAGAGSGKTHHLVGSYLAEALKKGSFAHILAITFTNKATQEMKTRVLETLHQLSAGNSPSLEQEYVLRLGCGAVELQTKAKNLLSTLLHQYNDCSIYTIDHFFQRVVHAFGEEEYDIELHTKKVLEWCTREVFGTLPHYPSLENWLTTFALQKLAKGKTWNIAAELTLLGEALVQRTALGVEPFFRDNHYTEVDKLLTELYQQGALHAERLAAFGSQALDLIQAHGIPAQAFAWGEKGVIGFFKKLHAKNFALPGARARKAATAPASWLSKEAPDRAAAEGLVKEHLMPLLQDALVYYDTYYPFYATLQAIEPLHHALAATARLHDLLQEYCAKHEVVLMAHVPFLIKEILAQTSMTLLYEKVGKRYTACLLDEFQDVSTVQWEGLKPLLLAGLAQGVDSLLVGDVKQSIYRWRGGEPSLFLKGVVEEVGKERVQEGWLSTNFRSKEEVVQFNNAFFEQAVERVAAHLLSARASEADNKFLAGYVSGLRQAYTSVRQQAAPNGAQGGYVQLNLRDDDVQEQALQQTITIVEQVQEQGYKPGQICILVRSNHEAQLLISGLASHQQSPLAKRGVQYEGTTGGGGSLGAHPVIKLLTAALSYLVAPDDLLNRAHLLYWYQTCKGTVERGHEEFLYVADDERVAGALPPAFCKLKEAWAQLPLTTLVRELMACFSLDQQTWAPYCNAFQECLFSWSARGNNSVPDFLAFWKEEGATHPLSGQEGGPAYTTVMTIHQAKGLAFDVVILPFCSWDLDHPAHGRQVVWCQGICPPFAALGAVPVYYGTHLQATAYNKDYYQEQCATYLEALNLLYVAFTRARDRLYIMADMKTGEQLKDVADLVTQVLDPLKKTDGARWDPVKQQLSFGQETPHTALTPAPVQGGVMVPLHCDPVRPLEPFAQPADSVGSLWHEIVAEAVVAADIAATIHRYMQAGTITAQQGANMLQCVARWWHIKELADWFSGRWEVKRECTIVSPAGLLVRPDRVMILDDHAVVLDFKTGMPHPDHARQVEHYAALLRAMGYPKVEGYLFYIGLIDLRSINYE